MPINSRAKGANGERELAHILADHGYDTRRGVQYQGGKDSPDVVGLKYIHLECKRVEKLNLDDAMAQASRDSAGGDNMPAVFHRKNAKPWKVTMLLEDWLKLYSEFYSGKEMEE